MKTKDLQVVWLDLAYAYGTVPHDLIYKALDFFYVPEKVKDVLANISVLQRSLHYQEVHDGLSGPRNWDDDEMCHINTTVSHVYGVDLKRSKRY